jgi:quercetin dioxygenase-like cupin family protein
MQTKPALSEIRNKSIARDSSAVGGTHARSTLNDIERAEGEGMGITDVDSADVARHLARKHELSGRSMTFDLTTEADDLTLSRDAVQNARTLAKLDGLRLVLLKLSAGKTLERHQASHQMTIQTLRGHVAVHVDGIPTDAPAGIVVVLESRVPHDIFAQEDSTLLLTVSGPTTRA